MKRPSIQVFGSGNPKLMNCVSKIYAEKIVISYITPPPPQIHKGEVKLLAIVIQSFVYLYQSFILHI